MPVNFRNKTYLRSDIYSVLRSLGQNNTRLVQIAPSNDLKLYHAGYVSALIAVAEAFGIEVTQDFHRLESAGYTDINAGQPDDEYY